MPNGVGDLIKGAVALHPERLAIIELGLEQPMLKRSLTYAELDRAIDRVAAATTPLGLVAGDRVMVAISNRADFFIHVFGLARAGVVPVIVNPRLKAQDYEFLLCDSMPKAVVTDGTAQQALEAASSLEHIPHRFSIDHASDVFEKIQPAIERGEGVPVFVADEDSPAFIHYTSGSTGRPKGVVTTHRGLVRHFLDLQPYFLSMYRSAPVNIICAPVFHTNGTGNAMISMVTLGTLVILPRFDARAMLQAISEFRVTTALLVSTMLMGMLAEPDLLDTLDLSSLEAILCGSAPTGRGVLDAAAKSLRVPVYQVYGSTEASVALGHFAGQPHTLESCGRPVPGVECKLIDEQGLESEEGELWIRSPALASGYLNQPEEAARKFVDGWFKTGDILNRDRQGYYFFRGRTDDMFICGGENIYPVEVERLLLRHGGVRNACVVGVPHETKGSVPAAMIEPVSADVNAEDIKAYCLENAPAYAHPRIIEFVDAFPIAPTGKIDRRAVREMLMHVSDTMRVA